MELAAPYAGVVGTPTRRSLTELASLTQSSVALAVRFDWSNV
jgi:hypothetical protein